MQKISTQQPLLTMKKWQGEECNDVQFKALKAIMCDDVVLKRPRGRPFVLSTDASTEAIAAVLVRAQIDEEGRERLIEFAPRTLRQEYANGAQESEELAIIWGINHVRHVLTLPGQKFRPWGV